VAKELKLPDLGEGVEEGDVVGVHVTEGDTVEKDQTVIEVETEKAVLPVPSDTAGKVSKVHVKEGDTISVGATLLTFAGEGEEAPEKEEKAEEEAPKEKPAEKEKPKAEQPAAKKKEEAPAKEKPEQKPEKEAKPAARKEEEKPAAAPAKGEPIPAGPATRRLARELNVDLEAVAQAHPGERLTEEHIKEYARRSRGEAAPAGAPETPELPDFTKWGPVERKKFTSLQRKTAAHLHTGWRVAPHVTQFDEADVTAMEALRKRYGQTEQGKEIRLTVTAFILKASAIMLKRFPTFNTSLDMSNNELVFKDYYHLGVAVDTEQGLIVPVLRDVDKKSVLQIAKEMGELAERTRERKIELEELRGGTFTVTNLGGIGGTGFTPVINYPEVAILGVARGKKQPKLINGEWTERMILPLCLSYDHRVINGADGARFLRRLAAMLEDPEMLLLQT
jgi:pyruvate dehydrogenase E2 component (dihydrolipoamide acetyltransferase)